MTDSQILLGIQNNNPVVWRYICRNLKSPFIATLKRFCLSPSLSSDDWEDIFQEACMILMENVKKNKFEERQGSTLFSYFVEIGKRTMQAALRKKAKHHPVPEKNDGSPHIVLLWPGTTTKNEELESEIVSAEDKQKEQDLFLDRVFDSIPDACKTLLKKFYWDHKPMDEIASILSLRNADTAKTKKNRCMNQFKEIAKKLIENDEYAEEAVRACVERAVLKELLADERLMQNDASIKMAALEIDEDKKNPEDR
jgi:RNA polymerase sigma factor (sigma-70 family)